MNYPSHKKIIPYQLIAAIQKDIELLDSLDEYFHSLLDYFSLAENPGIQENVGSYYSNQLILADLYHEYQELSTKFRQKLHALKSAEGNESELIEFE